MIVSRGEKPESKLERIRTTAATDAKAVELLRQRGEAFTVPAFCRAWLEVMGQRKYADGPKPVKNSEGERYQN